MDNRKVIYYQDELNDEFSTAVIEAKKIDGDYVYDRKGPVRAFTRFFWYRIVATPIAFLYAELSLHQRSVGREKLKPFRKQGIYLYGNHTQAIGDPFTPNVFCFPKRVSFIVHANNVSMPYLGRINPSLGAIPLPDTRDAYRNFQDCIATSTGLFTPIWSCPSSSAAKSCATRCMSRCADAPSSPMSRSSDTSKRNYSYRQRNKPPFPKVRFCPNL